MTVKPHHTIEQLYTLYRTRTNVRPARRIGGVWPARKGLACAEIMAVTGVALIDAAEQAQQGSACDPSIIQSVCRALCTRAH